MRKIKKNHGLMIDRINCLKHTAKELHDFIIKMIKIENDYENELAKLFNFDINNEDDINNKKSRNSNDNNNIKKKRLSLFGTKEHGGTIYNAAIAIDSLFKNKYEQHNDMNKLVFSKIIKSCNEYLKSVNKKHKYFTDLADGLIGKLENNRKNMKLEWSKYENVLSKTLNQMKNKINTSPKSRNINRDKRDSKNKIEIDPFMFGKSYDLCQRKYKLSLIEYNKEVSRLFSELIIADKNRMDGIKKILIDYFLAKKAKVINHCKLLESSILYIRNIDKDKDVNEFINRFHINFNSTANSNNNTLKNTPSNNIETNNNDNNNSNKNTKQSPIVSIIASNMLDINQSFSIHSRELSALIFLDVIKWGKIYKPGRFITSSYKPLHAIVTKFGFFHAFNDKQVS